MLSKFLQFICALYLFLFLNFKTMITLAEFKKEKYTIFTMSYSVCICVLIDSETIVKRRKFFEKMKKMPEIYANFVS